MAHHCCVTYVPCSTLPAGCRWMKCQKDCRSHVFGGIFAGKHREKCKTLFRRQQGKRLLIFIASLNWVISTLMAKYGVVVFIFSGIIKKGKAKGLQQPPPPTTDWKWVGFSRENRVWTFYMTSTSLHCAETLHLSPKTPLLPMSRVSNPLLVLINSPVLYNICF